MRDAYSKFVEAGAKVVTVSGKSASVAASMAPTMPFPLLLDPDHSLREALEIGRLSMAQTMHPKGAVNYAKSWVQAKNARVYPDEATQTPAVYVFDAEQNVTWKHLGKTLGDYPPIDEILRHL